MTFVNAKQQSLIELTQEEMLTISQEISLKYSPNTDSLTDEHSSFHNDPCYAPSSVKHADTGVFYTNQFQQRISAKELHVISETISRSFAPAHSSLEPELFLLPVDPYHLYAYWNIGEQKMQTALDKALMDCLTLRIYWRPDTGSVSKRSSVWFDVATESRVASQKVRLPIDDSSYAAAVGYLKPDHSFAELAYSNVVQVPPASGKARIQSIRYDNDAQLLNYLPLSLQKQLEPPAAEPVVYKAPLLPSQAQNSLYQRDNNDAYRLEPGWLIKLHIGSPSADNAYRYQVAFEFISLFKNNMLDIELIPDFNVIDAVFPHSKTASGRGI
ncbi:MAG: DUF4912 domain-containing protein [Methylococcales bacterium]